MRRWPALVALGTYLAVLATLTLGSRPEEFFDSALHALREVPLLHDVGLLTVERTANVVLFVPFGLLLCLAYPRVSRVMVWAGCAVVSIGVELYQWLLPDRDPTLVDIATNSAGAAIGVLLAAAVQHRSGRNARALQTSR